MLNRNYQFVDKARDLLYGEGRSFTPKADQKGTGLGLAVSYGIIDRRRGRIEVQSEVGWERHSL